jgi:hypothetical protein
MSMSAVLRLSSSVLVATAVLTTSAGAAIKCKTGSQLVGGQWMATPIARIST